MNKIVKKYGYLIFLKLFISPFIIILTTPFMTIKLFWNCRVLIQGKIKEYHRFSGIPSANCFFYWTQAYNLKKFGVNGVSNLMGLGSFNLSNMFHVPRIGNFLFWRFSTIVTLISFISFALLHCIWMLDSKSIYPIYVSLIILFSVLLYSCIDRVNYNSLGWMFFPFFIWSISQQEFWLSGILSAIIGFLSITVAVFTFIISTVFFISILDLKYLYILLPLALSVLIRLYPAFKGKRMSGSIFSHTLKLIGVINKKNKYKRTKRISLLGFYFSILFSIYFVIALYQVDWILNPYIVTIFIFISLLYLGESARFRFADSHSYLISTWSVIAAYTIVSQNPILLVTFLFVSNPIPLFGLFCTKSLPVLKVPERRPIFVGNAITKVRKFLKGISPGEKILFQFDNPNGSYNKIFDGYRNFYELLLYCGSIQDLNIFPDWYFIQETNAPDGIDVWGRNLADVFVVREKVQFDYFIAYETELNPLPVDFRDDCRIFKMRSLELSTMRNDFSPDPPDGMDEDPLILNLYAVK